MERVLIIVCALLVAARAGPISLTADSKSCSRACTDRGKFNYVPGRTYSYQYDSDIETTFQGASEDKAALHLAATVQLEILSKCEISMRLNDVKMTEYDPVGAGMKPVSSEFKEGLEKFPVRMSFQDGGIDDICQSGPEPVWVMNIKRGIISLIQNNMHNFESNRTVTETDVSGVCDTEYFVQETGWYETTIGKSKNLLGCTERQGYHTAVQGVPYTAQSDIQSLPLLKSDHNCVHEIDRQQGFLKTAKCTEQHMFRPFSKSDSGAVTTNKQTMTYIRYTTGTMSPAPITSRVPLKFEHVHDVNADGWNRKDITRKLVEICEKTKSGIRPETPKLFTDLVYLMKSADIDTLSDINEMLSNDKICPENLSRTRKFFLDALPMAGTSASVHMITKLITSKVISGIEADMWLTTLSFIKNPTKDMLKEVKPLINSAIHSEKAMLSVGTMVHSYCYHHGNCENDEMVKAIISAFTNKMAKGCKVKGDNMKSTLMALRGLGNAGYATSAIDTLTVCIKTDANPIEIRLSAIEAFRRMPCDSDRTGLMRLLQDTSEDSELRIAAYRVLMECPSTKILAVVRNTLAREEVNQVGSYIWTHLTNLMETSDRHKQDIRALLEDETFKKEFDMDKRKFSRNYEGSLFIEKLNTGAKVEGDLIWSSKSFIPRSAMVNLTFDLFGHSVNLFEVGGRAEGLEYFFESMFGPNGYFRNSEEESASTAVVPKNIGADKLKKIDKRFNSQMADLRGSMYMRMFGNELRYTNFKGLDSLLSGPDFNILDMLIKLSENNDITYTHSSMFMDSSYIIPTSSGFPLNLTVNGTAMIDLKMKGKMDLRHPPSLNIDGLIKPSAAIDISSMMSVDAFVTKSGIKMVSTLHTSTSLQGKINVDEKGSLTTEFDMPEPRMEIIDVKSSFFTIHRDMEREQTMIKKNRQSLAYCSPEKIVTITGLELCAEVAYPNASMKSDAPFFPLTGPASAGIYLYNRDKHVKYRMEAKSIHNRDKNIIHFIFDTPNSRINRHVEVDFSLNKKDLTLDATLASPWKQASFQGSIKNTNKVMGINGKMNLDGQAPYSIDAKLVSDVTGNTYLYKPSVEIQFNQNKPASVRGEIQLKNWKRLDLQFEADGIFNDLVSAKLAINNKDNLIGVQGSIDLAKNEQYSFDVNMATTKYKNKVTFKPLVSVRTPGKEAVAFGGDVMYIFGKGININLVLDKLVEKKISLKGKIMKAEKRRRAIYNTNLKFASGLADFLLKAKLDKKSLSAAVDVDFTYVIRRIARNNIKLVSKVIDQSSKALTRAKASLNLEVKRNPEINLKLLTDISHNKKHTGISGDLWYGDDFSNDERHVEMQVEMNRKIQSLMDASADIMTRVKVPAMNISLTMKGTHSHDERNLNSEFSLKIGRRQPLETSLQIHDKTSKQLKFDVNYQLRFAGCNLGIDHVVEQTVDNKYVSTLTTQLKKDQQNIIVTTIAPEGRKVAIDSDIKLHAKKPIRLQGEFGIDPNDFITSISYESGSTKYAGSLTSATEMAKSSWLVLDVQYPSKHTVMSLGGKIVGEVLYGDAELKVDNDDSYSISAWCEVPRPEKLNGSIELQYGSHKLVLNAHHTKGSKYTSHVDFSWDPAKIVSADTVLSITNNALIGSAKMSSPFTTLSKLDIDAKLTHDSEQYNADVTIELEDSKSFNIKSEIKKPISIKTLVASLSLRSPKIPIYGIKTITLEVNHKLSNSLASSARFGWNKQFVQTEVILQNTTKKGKYGTYGSVDIKTSYQYVKKGKLVVSQDYNGRTLNTDITFNRNKKTVKIESKLTHQSSLQNYASTGLIKIMSTISSISSSETSWNHVHSGSNIETTLSSSWGKKNNNNVVSARFTCEFADTFTASFDLRTPFSTVRDTQLQTSYIKNDTVMNGKLSMNLNDNKIGSSEIGYVLEKDKYTATIAITIPDLEVNTNVEAELTEDTASIQASITPSISMSLEATTKLLKSDTLVHTIILWKSSLPGYEQVRYTYEVLSDDGLATTTILEYGAGKEIKFETSFGYDSTDKYASASLTTPFESLEKLQGGMSFRGSPDAFKSNAFVEFNPFFDKTSATLNWETNTGLVSSLRIEMPIPEYPYIQADVSGLFSKPSSELDIKIEYKPKQIIHFEIDHKQVGQVLSISAKANSPFGMVSINHDGMNNGFKCAVNLEDQLSKKYGIDLAFKNDIKTEGSLTVSLHGKRDVSVLFTHTGHIKDFSIHTEVQHNRKNNFVSDLSLTAGENVKVALSGSLRTQLISETEEYETSFDLAGNLMKLSTHGEIYSTSLGKSQADLNIDLTSSYTGNVIIKSPLIRNIKASFNHFKGENYIQSDVDVIHGGSKIVDIQASLNKRDSVIGEIKVITPLHEAINLITRFDGELRSFSFRTEASHGINKADIDIFSKVSPKLVQQKVSFSATGMRDVSIEFSHNGDLSKLKSFGEINVGENRHRADVMISNAEDKEASLSLESPLIDPTTIKLQHTGSSTDFRCRGELIVSSEISSVDLSYSNSANILIDIALRSPFIKDVSLLFEHDNKLNECNTNARITVEGIEDTSLKISSSKQPREYSLAVTTPIDNFRKFDTSLTMADQGVNSKSIHFEYTLEEKKSEVDIIYIISDKYTGQLSVKSHLIPDSSIKFEHEGKLNNFRSHAGYSFGNKKSDINVMLSLLSRYEGLVAIDSHLIPPVSVGFEHEGNLKQFRSHGEFSLGLDKRELDISAAVGKDIDISLSYNCPEHGVTTATFTHSGNLKNFSCHAELIGDGKWEGDLTFSTNNKLYGTLTLTPPHDSTFRPLSLAIDHSEIPHGVMSKGELQLGDHKISNEFHMTIGDQLISTGLKISSTFLTDLTLNIRYEGIPVDFKIHVDSILDTNEYSFEAKYSLKNTVYVESIITTPFKGFRNLRTSFEINRTPRNLRSNAKFAIEKAETVVKVIADTRDLSNVECSFELTSTHLNPVEIKISGNTATGKYIYYAELNISNQYIFGSHVSYTNDKLTASHKVSADLVVDGIKYNILELTSDASGIKASIEITESTTMSFELLKEPHLKLVGSAYIVCNICDNKQLTANIKFEENKNNYEGNYHVLLDENKLYDLTFTILNSKDKTTGTFEIEDPIFLGKKQHVVEFTLLKRERVFEFGAKVTRESTDLVELNLSSDINNGKYVDFSLKSNKPHQLSITYGFKNNQQKYTMDWDLTHNLESLLNGNFDMTLRTEPVFVDVTANVKINTKTASYSLYIDPTEHLYKSNAVLRENSETSSMQVEFDARQDLKASFTVQIPGMEDIVGTLSNERRTYRSKTEMSIKFNSTHKVEYDMDVKWRNGLDLSVSLKTPFKGFEKSALKVDYEGSLPNFKSNINVNVANKPVVVSLAIASTDKSTADMILKTPFEPFENVALNMYHSGSLSNFKTGGKLVYVAGEEIKIDIEHSWVGLKVESQASLMSPFTDEIIVSVNHSGTQSDFSSDYELKIGRDIKYNSKTSIKTGSKYLDFTNTLSSTMNGESFDQILEIKHDGSLDNFKTEALFQSLGYLYRFDTAFQLEPEIMGSIGIMTPFENFRDIKTSFSHKGSSNGVLSMGEIQYAQNKKLSGKFDLVKYGLRRLTTNIEIRTPFEGMEINRLTYKHSGDLDSIECELDSNIIGKTITGSMTASIRPLSINIDIGTDFKGFESIGLSGKYLENKNRQIGIQIEAKLNQASRIIIESSLSRTPLLSAEITISSPFKQFRDFSGVISQKQLAKGSLEIVKFTHNGESLIDAEFDHNLLAEHKRALFILRAPRSMKFELEGDFSLEDTDFDLSMNWNTKSRDSNMRLEAAYDIRRNENRVNVKLTQPNLPGEIISVNGLLKGKYSKADLSWGMRPADKAGYEINFGKNDGKLKLILPTRSLVIAGSHRGTITEGSFMWDADVDTSKKVGFKSILFTSRGVAKADVTLDMPSIGKNVRVGSEFQLNQGRVIFDGKTVLSYNGNSKKNLVFTSKLEDISTQFNKNYSFSFGVSHPYTTVGISVNSHAGKSDTSYTAGVGLEYLTVKEQTKKFQIGANIDKLRKSVSFELKSPVKSISISGSVQTNDKFRVSLLNAYDHKQPLNTHLTIDTAARSIDFVSNFDLDNPRDEFHINAKYVNSSAVATEIFHIVNRNKLTDVLLTARLNNSHLVHSRLHWRPEMLEDLEAFIERKAEDYNRRLHSAMARIEPEIVEEVVEKFRKIWEAISEEIGEENIAQFEAAVVPYLSKGLHATVAMSTPLLQQLKERLVSYDAASFRNIRSIPKIKMSPKIQSYDTEMIDALRLTTYNHFDRVLSQIKLSARHVPGYVTNIATDAVEKLPVFVSAQVKSFKLIEVLEYLVKSEVERVEKDLEAKLLRLEEIAMGSLKSPFTVYDPVHGEIQMEVYSIIPLKSLDELPAGDFIESIRTFERIQRLATSFKDGYESVSMPSLSGEWLPPFTGVASIAMGHKITTFDGYVYDLDKDCTFMLTRDYVDGNFSLILSNDGYTTLTLLTPGKPISISSQEEILVGDKPASLPLTEGYVTMTKNDAGIVTIRGGDHFNIEYDLTIDHITVRLNGWYHGKTGGLLGVYDNEPSNDLMTPFKKVVPNTSRFAGTWAVGSSKCQ